MNRFLATLAFVLSLAAAPAAAADRITVFAAASLKTALDRIAADWEGAEVVLSYAGSSALARQIEAGAPADIFISASPDWMDALAGQGLIRPETRVDLLGNSLVLVRHGAGAAPVEIGADFDLLAALGDGRLAMALVDAVPAGIYGREALTALGFWDSVAARVAQADNVRAALALVALGEAPLGIVYATDARAEPRVSVAAVFPADAHAPIVYPAALTAEADPDSAGFLAYLQSEAARAVFAAEGFATPGAAP